MNVRVVTKASPLETKAVDLDASTFTGYSAGIGNKDAVNDIIHPGAFTKTIKERVGAGLVKLLNGHNRYSTSDLFGVVTAAKEVRVEGREMAKKFRKDATHLLFTEFDVSKADPAAQVALGKVSEGILDALSVGIRIIKQEFTDEDGQPFTSEDGSTISPEWEWMMGRGIRQIKEVAWQETSLVVWGANTAARTIKESTDLFLLDMKHALAHEPDVDVDDATTALKALLYIVKSCGTSDEDTLSCVLSQCKDLGLQIDTDKLARGADCAVANLDDRAVVDHFLTRFAQSVKQSGSVFTFDRATLDACAAETIPEEQEAATAAADDSTASDQSTSSVPSDEQLRATLALLTVQEYDLQEA